jgi:ATP/maltotriose-dependent transcriptional regulator MalT
LSAEAHPARFLPWIYLHLATVSATEGAFERAARYVTQAEEAAGSQPSDQFSGRMHRCRAHVAAQRGDWDAAVMQLEESLHCLQRANLPVEGCRARLSLGRAYANRDQDGDRGRACEQLRAAMPLLTQIEATEELVRAKAQLERWNCRS